ncbi:FAD-dependent oxidoreductase [Granulicoccus phenolivorans]|uniref:FAD-dependent oxidoreductase n=1 Tax=Granulicoccus phenolivorans TaxID=266854 RepID=UPI00042872C0|nr:FAD-dependent oxidoreductase [Granulicoccus phenolivorans]
METLQVAIVGAGPSGLYAAEAITGQDQYGYAVDVIDQLPTPFGLLRYGVAPDHLKIKSLAEKFQGIIDDPQVHFLGNVEVGRDITVDELRERYHAVIYAYGSASDRKLNIPGEDLPGCLSAREFVAWYSGYPDTSLPVDLDHPAVAVIGLGNVAVDVARILGLPAAELDYTDMPSYVLEALNASSVQAIHLLGRRGPLDVKFGLKEFRELTQCRGIGVHVDPADLVFTAAEQERIAGDRTLARLVDLLQELAVRPVDPTERQVYLDFWSTPTAVLGTDHVTGLEITDTRTKQVRRVEVAMVLKAAGYLGVPLPGLPFDERAAVVPSEEDRVLRDGQPSLGEYVTGWIGRGATGVIGVNRHHARNTIAALLADAPALLARERSGDALGLLRERGVAVVTEEGWSSIDAAEIALGATAGRARTKISSRLDLLATGTE